MARASSIPAALRTSTPVSPQRGQVPPPDTRRCHLIVRVFIGHTPNQQCADATRELDDRNAPNRTMTIEHQDLRAWLEATHPLSL